MHLETNWQPLSCFDWSLAIPRSIESENADDAAAALAGNSSFICRK
jgi:hypothetical protein